jgi:hypothetical protein
MANAESKNGDEAVRITHNRQRDQTTGPTKIALPCNQAFANLLTIGP